MMNHGGFYSQYEIHELVRYAADRDPPAIRSWRCPKFRESGSWRSNAACSF